MAKVAALILTLSLLAGGFVAFATPARAATDTITLYGSATSGWGFAAANESVPGPTLKVTAGDTVAITVHSSDGVSHEFFIDLNGNAQPDSGEPTSGPFSATATVPSFSAPAVGTYTYYCFFHESTMKGSFVVQSASSGGPSSTTSSGIDPLLVVGIVIIVAILVVVGVVVLRRKK